MISAEIGENLEEPSSNFMRDVVFGKNENLYNITRSTVGLGYLGLELTPSISRRVSSWWKAKHTAGGAGEGALFGVPGIGTGKLMAGAAAIGTAENYLSSGAYGDWSLGALGNAAKNGAIECIPIGAIDIAAKRVLSPLLRDKLKALSKTQQTFEQSISEAGGNSKFDWRTFGLEGMDEEIAARVTKPSLKPNIQFSAEGSISRTTEILSKYSEVTGTAAEKLQTIIQDERLAKIANELYRPGATIGDGGTADILIHEHSIGSSKHLVKATERLKQLDNLIYSKSLCLNDLDIAEALKDDLERAINLFD